MASQNYLTEILLPDYKPPKGMKGEVALCAEIAGLLRQMSIENRLPYVWFHVPNQFSGHYRGVFGAMMAWMGRICGIPDYAFMGRNGCFFVEVKTLRGIQSDPQKIVQKWCENVGVPYYLCRSLKEIENVLKNERTRTERADIERQSLLLYARMAENKELSVLRHVSENAERVEQTHGVV